MFSIRAIRLFTSQTQRPWLRGRRRVCLSELTRAADAGDADAIEGLLSLALSDESSDSSHGQQALATLEDLLQGDEDEEAAGEGAARTRRLARLEVQAQCFELVERDTVVIRRMPTVLLRAAVDHASARGYHVTGDEILQQLALRQGR